MAKLITTYLYVYGDTITVRVSAYNTYGWSSETQYTGGATIKTAPVDMAAPTVTARTDSSITISFSTVTTSPADGGEPVDGYSVDYRLSTDPVNTWTADTTVTTSPKTITGLTAGLTYYVAVRAHNVHGYSGRTNYATVVMNNVPNAPLNVAIAESTDKLGMEITWDASVTAANLDSVTKYKVEI